MTPNDIPARRTPAPARPTRQGNTAGASPATPPPATPPPAVPARPAPTPAAEAAQKIRTIAIDPATGQYFGPVVIPPGGIPAIRRETVKIEGIDLDKLLTYLVGVGGSDLHLSTGNVPMARVNGRMQAVPNQPVLQDTSVEDAVFPVLSPTQKQLFQKHHELDFAYTIEGVSRFRANMMQSSGNTAAVFRVIPWEIRNLETLGLPPILSKLAMLPRGLVLVTGPTGSGKSTTLAAILDKANRERYGHIVTIEDPVEYVHRHRNCVVNQREVGADTESFSEALKHVLRQDPDIILIGEMRDLETMSAALTAAETGHLVFATLHTQSAQSTINRIVDAFPTSQQEQVRAQLAATLKAVVAQSLVPTADRKGRIAVTEIMLVNPAIATMIRRGDEHMIPQTIQSSAKEGMHTLNQELARLVRDRVITEEEAREVTPDVKDLLQLLGERGNVSEAAASTARRSALSNGFGTDMGIAQKRDADG